MHTLVSPTTKEPSFDAASTHHEEEQASNTNESEVKTALRKVDRRLLPLLALLYLLAFLDRGNSAYHLTHGIMPTTNTASLH